MGTWHNIEMYPSRFQDGTCSNADYELVDGNVVVVNSQVNDQRLETITGVAVPASDGSAKLVVTFPVPGSDRKFCNQTIVFKDKTHISSVKVSITFLFAELVSSDYWVLATDYSNYAFVYSCRNLDDNEMQGKYEF